MTQDLYVQAARYVKEATAILITAGAGMGVDSGLPDFRGNEGFWQAYPALGRTGVSFKEIANGEAFEEQPLRSWGFYGHRLQLYREIEPHRGFGILKNIAATKAQGAFVFTSNVDGQFQKAGYDHDRIVECHGSIHHLQCLEDCAGHIWSAQDLSVRVDMEQCLLTSPPPTCPHCGGVARPNILMFNDWKWCGNRSDAQQHRLEQWLDTVERLVVIEMGAGLAIPTVRRLGEALKCPLIRFNPAAPQVKGAQHIGFPVGAYEGLQGLEVALASLE